MGMWQIDTDTLAGSRFVVSPLAETVSALNSLERARPDHPGERAWLDAHLPAYRARQAADPVAARLVPAGLGGSWSADFLTPTPTGEGAPTFEEELAPVRATTPERARADLTVALGGGPLPPLLDRDDLARRAADVLHWVWLHTVLPDWPRRRRIIEADIVARTGQLSHGGWAAALGGLCPGMRWLGGVSSGSTRTTIPRSNSPAYDCCSSRSPSARAGPPGTTQPSATRSSTPAPAPWPTRTGPGSRTACPASSARAGHRSWSSSPARRAPPNWSP